MLRDGGGEYATEDDLVIAGGDINKYYGVNDIDQHGEVEGVLSPARDYSHPTNVNV